MAMKTSKLSSFDYCAHVQKADGSIAELAGTKEDYSVKHVYQWLWEQAQALGGWLLADAITESEVDTKAAKPDETAGSSGIDQTTPSTEAPRIGDAMHWSVYKGASYPGASRVHFKENSNG